MKITGQKVFIANASRTNFVFVKLYTDEGIEGGTTMPLRAAPTTVTFWPRTENSRWLVIAASVWSG